MGYISFDTIPIDLRTPGQFVEISNARAVQGLVGIPTKILVLGQKHASVNLPVSNPVRITSADQAADLFGRGSMLHMMFVALKANNRFTESWAYVLADDEAAQAATGAVTFSAAATAAGTLEFYVGGPRPVGRKVRIGVAAAEATTALATKLVAAINADPDLPVTAAVDGVNTSKVNLTMKWKGETGNALDLRFNYYQGEVKPEGLGVAITAMSGGTANPDVSAAIADMSDDWFTDVAFPYTDAANLAQIEAEAARRYTGTVMMDMQVYTFATATHSALATLGSSRNSPHGSIMGGKGVPTPPWAIAAMLAGIAAFEGKNDPARPLQTLPMVGFAAPAVEDRFDMEERNLLLHDGISTFTVDAGGVVRIERVITTYQTNAYGLEDPSYLDVETMKTLAFMRYSVRARISQRFPRHKLAKDGTRASPGQALVTPKDIRNELVALAGQWEEAGLLEDIEQFKADLLVERDDTDVNRVNAIIPPNLVNQFRVFAAKVEFRA